MPVDYEEEEEVAPRKSQHISFSQSQLAKIIMSILIPILCCVWYLSGRLQRIEDLCVSLEKRIDRGEMRKDSRQAYFTPYGNFLSSKN